MLLSAWGCVGCGSGDKINSSMIPLGKENEVRPLIGICGNFGQRGCELAEGYYASVVRAGGVPVVLPPTDDVSTIMSWLDVVDGLVLSGGNDVNPVLMGHDPSPQLHDITAERDAGELLLVDWALRRHVPILGICRGMQVLAEVAGGSIYQDISEGMGGARIKHMQDAPRHVSTHFVRLKEGSLVEELLARDESVREKQRGEHGAQALVEQRWGQRGAQKGGREREGAECVAYWEEEGERRGSGYRLAVNSFHHQAVKESGERFCITARSADGVAEAMESVDRREAVLAVQWHPEAYAVVGDECMLPLFVWLRKEALRYRAARDFHRQHLTLDSHVDTPMFFGQGVDFGGEDAKVLCDNRKMWLGGLDAVFMVAYLPQRACDDAHRAAAGAMARRLLGEIEVQVAEAPHVALARTSAELLEHKRRGLRSVVKGIENGFAFGTDIENVGRFRALGVAYTTLCHNGDNDICDAACKSEGRHGGLSAYGREVVRRMNDCGMLVDLSHAGEKTFYDVLKLSRVAPVCSHSCCKALCDHARNLTDAQLRALAAKGGVAQMTFYHGFVRNDGQEATVDDVVKHILHAIEVAGVEHVGIGSDFDGDGGVKGLESEADMMLLTRRLMDAGLTEEDLSKIWGGNFIRVWQAAEKATRG